MRKIVLTALSLLIFLVISLNVNADSLYVDVNDIACNDTIGMPYCKIQAAVDNSSAGDEINVASGTYNEQVIINKDNLVVQSSSGASSTIIDATGKDTANGGVILDADGCTLDGFTVKDFNDQAYENKIIRINGDNNTVQNNIIQGNLNQLSVSDQTEYGILCYGSNNLIGSNEVYDIGYIGINIVGEPHSDASDNTVSNNNVHNIGMYGITNDRSPRNTITQNTISDVVGGTLWGYYYNPNLYCWGIVVWGESSSGTIIENQDVTNLPNGIVLSATHYVTVQNCDISNNDNIGIKLSDSSWIYDSNDNNLIQGNTIRNNKFGIFVTEGYEGIGENNIIGGCNHIYDNTEKDLRNDALQEINAESNWWGQFTPYFSSIISGNVDYDPWSVDEECEKFSDELGPQAIGVGITPQNSCPEILQEKCFDYEGEMRHSVCYHVDTHVEDCCGESIECTETALDKGLAGRSYAFEGETITFAAKVFDNDGIVQDCVKVYVTLDNGYDPIQAACVLDHTNGAILEIDGVEHPVGTVGWFNCLFTVEPAASGMTGEYWVSVMASDKCGINGCTDTAAGVISLYLNPAVSLTIESQDTFGFMYDVGGDKLGPAEGPYAGDTVYSPYFTVENTASPVSGLYLLLELYGKDMWDYDSSDAICPTTNNLDIQLVNYKASHLNVQQLWTQMPENYANKEFVFRSPNIAGNFLGVGDDITMRLRLPIPSPCRGNFDDGGEIVFVGRVI